MKRELKVRTVVPSVTCSMSFTHHPDEEGTERGVKDLALVVEIQLHTPSR